MLLLQPAVLLYTRSMMERAATQTARVIATRGSNTVVNDAALRAYAVRRLSSVPHAAIFHVGADSGWEITTTGDATSEEISVEIVGKARLLPLIGALSGWAGELEGDNIILRVRITTKPQPTWVEEGYDDWISMWA